ALRQHVGNGAAIRYLLQVDLRRQADLGALLAAGLLQAGAPPFDVARLDAVFLLQHAADPDVGSHLVFRHAERLALEVGRRLYAVGADVDAGVPEQPRYAGRDGDVMRISARRRHPLAAHRNLGDVELLVFEGAVERLLGRIRHRNDVAALDRRAAVEQRGGAVVIADGQAQFHGHFSISSALMRYAAVPYRNCMARALTGLGGVAIVACHHSKDAGEGASTPRTLPPCEYAAPSTINEAVALLANHSGEAKPLA